MKFLSKTKTPSFYEEELARIQKEISSKDPGSEDYEKLINEMKKLQEFCGREKEMKQFLTKEGRGNVVGKVVGFLGLGGLAFGLARYEKSGHLFSGSSSGVISGLIKIGTRFFG